MKILNKINAIFTNFAKELKVIYFICIEVDIQVIC